MIRRSFLHLPALALAPLFPASAASLEQAQKRLRAAIDEAITIASKAPDKAALRARIAPVLDKHLAMEVMTRRAVGPGWREFDATQQKQAITLFSTLVLRSYSNRFRVGEMPRVDIQSAAAPAAGRVDVTTNTFYQGNRYSVIYRMEEAEGWRTTDVVIEGVSMVANYRSQLDPVFKRGGVTAVLKSLEQSVARTE